MRGEQMTKGNIEFTTQGSPPHARGAVSFLGVINQIQGITPACAGSSVAIGDTVDRNKDHPRMRGEQLNPPPKSHRQKGSPPHARGAADFSEQKAAHTGITPACAGSSLAWACM